MHRNKHKLQKVLSRWSQSHLSQLKLLCSFCTVLATAGTRWYWAGTFFSGTLDLPQSLLWSLNHFRLAI